MKMQANADEKGLLFRVLANKTFENEKFIGGKEQLIDLK